MLALLHLLRHLTQFHQYIGATMSVAPIYWCNFTSCTISIGVNIWLKLAIILVLWTKWCCCVSSTNNSPYIYVYHVWCVQFFKIFTWLSVQQTGKIKTGEIRWTISRTLPIQLNVAYSLRRKESGKGNIYFSRWRPSRKNKEHRSPQRKTLPNVNHLYQPPSFSFLTSVVDPQKFQWGSRS